MSKLIKCFLSVILLSSILFSNELKQKELYDKNVSISKGSFKVFEFEKRIQTIKVSDEGFIEVDFVNDANKPLQAIKVFTKKLGNGNILVTFDDASSLHIDINITENLKSIIEVAKHISPNLEVKQTNGKLILRGKTQNQKTKNKILDLFAKAGVSLKDDLVDLVELENPDKMIRVKLYAVEINNDKGLDLKNNWFVSSKNYMEVPSGSAYYNEPLDSFGTKDENEVNNQRNSLVNTAIDNLMKDAVSLTGGLTGAANYLGRYFNAGLTLNYLSSKGVAQVLDETTLLTLENKEASFLAGGTINIKTQTTTAEGLPSTSLKEIKYGLQLDINAQNIVDDKFINLNIVTKSSNADFANTVDGIPNITEKSIITNVVVENSSTIVLGGLINRSNADAIEKIPLLGDIPVLGFIFTSKSFKEGKSELVFFITPEIVDPKSNNQNKNFEDKTYFKKFIDEKLEEQVKEIEKEKGINQDEESSN